MLTRLGRGLRAPFLLSAAAVAVYLWPAATAQLEYDRSLIAAGEVWRLLTCQWTHCSGSHLFFDVLVLLVAGTVYQLRGGQRLGLCLLASAAFIPIGLWVLLPEMARYRGLSGIDVAVTALLTTAMLREGISSSDRLIKPEMSDSCRRAAPISFALGTCENARTTDGYGCAYRKQQKKTLAHLIRQNRSLQVTVIPALLATAIVVKIGYEVYSGQAVFVDARGDGFVTVPTSHLLGAMIGTAIELLPSHLHFKPSGQASVVASTTNKSYSE